jgi:hypothetical protein
VLLSPHTPAYHSKREDGLILTAREGGGVVLRNRCSSSVGDLQGGGGQREQDNNKQLNKQQTWTLKDFADV